MRRWLRRTPTGLTARYAAVVSPDHDEQVVALKRLLDAEIRRQLAPQIGCWPLLVGVAGLLLGLVLLAGRV